LMEEYIVSLYYVVHKEYVSNKYLEILILERSNR